MLTTRISEGMTEYTYKGIVGYGMSEYLDQVVDGKPVGLQIYKGPTSLIISLCELQVLIIASGVPIPADLGSPEGPNQWF